MGRPAPRAGRGRASEPDQPGRPGGARPFLPHPRSWADNGEHRPLTAEEREALTASVHIGMGHPFPVVLREVARVARLESEKWRNFVAIPHRYGETPAG